MNRGMTWDCVSYRVWGAGISLFLFAFVIFQKALYSLVLHSEHEVKALS
ncbi:hypothetical protein H9I48_01920 [Wolbachia pipientis]|nr:hypothetical protein [Wolbachia pipientis]MBC6686005.1 hypothetical protein [Wolbachia pipientis]